MARVLMVDDEELIVKGIRSSLEQGGMEMDCAYDGEEVIGLAKKTGHDTVFLDVMLPKYDGYEVRQTIREFSDMPIIMLTVKDSNMDKILRLEYGADDYISEPFNILEIKTRIKAITRRSGKSKHQKREEPQSGVIDVDDFKVDAESYRVFIGEREISLAIREFNLLKLPVRNLNKVYSRETLLTYVWRDRAMDSGGVRTVDIHVRRLRKRIGPSPNGLRYAHTKWGVGYYPRVKA